MSPRMLRDEAGSASVLVLGLCILALAVGGMALDGARLLLARENLENAADGVGQAVLAVSDGARPSSSPPQVMEAWLDRAGIRATAELESSGEGVVVVLHGRVPTTFLGLLGIPELQVSARAHLRDRLRR